MNSILSHLFSTRKYGASCKRCWTYMVTNDVRRSCLDHSINYHLNVGTYVHGGTKYMWVYSDGKRVYNPNIDTDLLRINIDIIIKSFEHLLLLDCETNITDILTKYSDYMPITCVMSKYNVREMSEELFSDTMKKELMVASYKCMRCDCTFECLPTVDIMFNHITNHCIVP